MEVMSVVVLVPLAMLNGEDVLVEAPRGSICGNACDKGRSPVIRSLNHMKDRDADVTRSRTAAGKMRGRQRCQKVSQAGNLGKSQA